MTSDKLKQPLLFLRVSLFFVLLLGTLIKLVKPAGLVYVVSYSSLIPGLSGSVLMILGFVELLILFGFLLGFHKKITYGLVLVMNILSVLSVLHIFLSILNPAFFVLFFLMPVLAGSYLLFVLRDYDVLYTMD
jgi:putative oxidoreductase